MVTTVLDLLGSLLLIVGAALFVAAYSVPAAFAVAGVLVIALSYAIDRKAARS